MRALTTEKVNSSFKGVYLVITPIGRDDRFEEVDRALINFVVAEFHPVAEIKLVISRTAPRTPAPQGGLLEHGLDLRPLQTKRTAKRERPTEECEAAVEAILASPEAADEGAARSALLRLVPSPDIERRVQAPDQELKRMLDEMRLRLRAGRDRGGLDAGGKDAA